MDFEVVLEKPLRNKTIDGNILLLNDPKQISPMYGAITDLNVWNKNLNYPDIRLDII